MTSSEPAIWILWHLPPGGDPDDGKLIGVYASRDTALAAIARLNDRPGFRDHPTVTEDDEKPGFFMQRYELNKRSLGRGLRDIWRR